MAREIISFAPWLHSPLGRRLKEWECARFDAAVGDVFGYYAVQLGLPAIEALRASRMPYRWKSSDINAPLPLDNKRNDAIKIGTSSEGLSGIGLVIDPCHLPFEEQSIDLIAMPHTLELAADAHAALREAARVLVPEGRVAITGFNPVSAWGVHQRLGGAYPVGVHAVLDDGLAAYTESGRAWLGCRRLRDWLRLLDFEVESVQFGGHGLPVQSDAWIDRQRPLARWGERAWPLLGGFYFVLAVKRVQGVRLLTPGWKRAKAARALSTQVAGRGVSVPASIPAAPLSKRAPQTSTQQGMEWM
jgi:SAM-dependent methyltransferase